MTNKFKMIVGLFLVLAGLGFLGLTYFMDPKPSETSPVLGSVVHNAFDARSIITSDSIRFVNREPDLEKKDVVALFTLNSYVCSPCLSEVSVYARLLDELDEAVDSTREHFASAVVLLENDTALATRLIKLSRLQIAAGYGTPQALTSFLAQFPDESMQQLILVDLNQGVIFYHLELPPSSVTSLGYKRSVLLDAMQHVHLTNLHQDHEPSS